MTKLSSSSSSVVAVLIYLTAVLVVVGTNLVEETDPTYWIRIGHDELTRALKLQPINKRAKNVILFIGDGMGISTVTAARIYQGQRQNKTGEEGLMFFENFPYMGHTKTYNVDKQTPDSAGTATAFLCGVKNNYGTIGVDATVPRRNCTAQRGHELTSILQWSKDAGKEVGVVTTTRITHATPAAAYARSADRGWENDYDIRNADGNCTDIARQLVEDNPDIKVILGGGRRNFLPNTTPDPETGSTSANRRSDDRNLIEEWLVDKQKREINAQYVWNASSFYSLDLNRTDYLLGLFSPSHMDYEYVRTSVPDPGTGEAGEPSLAEMTAAAIDMLKKGPDGFFLLVEGGRIDHGHHSSRPKLALADTEAFDLAVRKAAEMTSPEETLTVVSADHSHVMAIGGYPSRGNSITGEEDVSLGSDDLPYTTILYGNGPGFNIEENGTREDITHIDVEDVMYRHQSAVPRSSETHGGEDVAVYAQGPMAHLFHATHEQHYIALVMAYASCVGMYANESDCAAALESSTPLPQDSSTSTTGTGATEDGGSTVGATGPPICPSDGGSVHKPSTFVYALSVIVFFTFKRMNVDN